MKRRALLTGTGLAVASPLAGCTAPSASHESGANSGLPTPSPITDYGLISVDTTGAYERIEIGSRRRASEKYRPVGVRVWNAGGFPEVEFEIWDVLKELKLHEKTYQLPRGQHLEVDFIMPSKYLIGVGVPAAEAYRTVLIDCHWFDCNGNGTTVAILDGGKFKRIEGHDLRPCPNFRC